MKKIAVAIVLVLLSEISQGSDVGSGDFIAAVRRQSNAPRWVVQEYTTGRCDVVFLDMVFNPTSALQQVMNEMEIVRPPSKLSDSWKFWQAMLAFYASRSCAEGEFVDGEVASTVGKMLYSGEELATLEGGDQSTNFIVHATQRFLSFANSGKGIDPGRIRLASENGGRVIVKAGERGMLHTLTFQKVVARSGLKLWLPVLWRGSEMDHATP